MCLVLGNSISVIIPILGGVEEAQIDLQHLLSDLSLQTEIQLEVIVAEGVRTTSKETSAIASLVKKFGFYYRETPIGRGLQMNAAAKEASGEYFLFLHCDSRLFIQQTNKVDPLFLARALNFFKETDNLLNAKTPDQRVSLAGHFPLQFRCHPEHYQRHRRAYRYYETKTRFNQWENINGDQGLFLARADFIKMQGFATDQHFFEDQKFNKKFQQLGGRFITLPGVMSTSGNRFEKEGLKERMILSGLIMGLYNTGFISFFEKAPDLYRAQPQGEKINLWPFCRLIWRLLWEESFLVMFNRWYRIGWYMAKDLWQVGLFLDLAFRPELGDECWQAEQSEEFESKFILKNFFERDLTPAVLNPFGQSLAALLTVFLFSFISLISFCQNRARE